MHVHEEYKDRLAFHPGTYLENLIEEHGLTQKEFANLSNLTEKNVSDIVNGKVAVTPDIAEKLANITGISFQSWINLQSSYDTEEGEADYFLSAHKEFIDDYQAISQVISEEES